MSAFTFTFYSNTADNRIVDKTSYLTQLGNTKTVIYKDNNDKGNPTLELSHDSTIDNANYAYCSETGYYYYLSEPMYSQQRVIYTTTVDLLMTYKSEIKNLKCIIARQESKYNAYLNDDRLPVLNKQEVSILPFPGGFTHPSNDSILLVVNGR